MTLITIEFCTSLLQSVHISYNYGIDIYKTVPKMFYSFESIAKVHTGNNFIFDFDHLKSKTE